MERVTAGERQVEPRKMGDIRQRWRGDTVFRKIDTPNTAASEKLLQFCTD
jgi:hypothetical protein